MFEKNKRIESAFLVGVQTPGHAARRGRRAARGAQGAGADPRPDRGRQRAGQPARTLARPSSRPGQGRRTHRRGEGRRRRCHHPRRGALARPAAQLGGGVRAWPSSTGRRSSSRSSPTARTPARPCCRSSWPGRSISCPACTRAWTHLSRQRGRGALGGEGETQLEQDRRTVRDRIAHLRSDLAAVRQQRGVQRQRRLRVPVPTCAIVGYTNAGKSCLLNRAHRRPRAGRGQALRHARPDHPPARAARQPEAARHRHRRLHPPPAARSRRGVQGHARGGRRRRFPHPRARRDQPRLSPSTTPPRSACWPSSAPTGRPSSPSSTRSTSPSPPRWSPCACSRPARCS